MSISVQLPSYTNKTSNTRNLQHNTDADKSVVVTPVTVFYDYELHNGKLLLATINRRVSQPQIRLCDRRVDIDSRSQSRYRRVGLHTVLFAPSCGNRKDQQTNIGAYTKWLRDNEGSQERFCDEWKADPKYGTEDNEFNYDFALCKLNETVIIDSNIKLELNEKNRFRNAERK